MESDLIGRIAESICADEAYPDQLATDLARQLVEDFRLQRITRWVPRMIDGERGTPVGSWHEAQMLMEVRPDVSSVDREYRFVSRWINPRE